MGECVKERKGFTLVELLAVIAILGVIAVIAYPSVMKNIRESKTDTYQLQIEEIKKASASWAASKASFMPTKEGEQVTLLFGELKKSGLIDKNLISAKTKKKFPNDMEIIITRKGKKYTYQVLDETGTVSNDGNYNDPSIILKGLSFEYIEVNSTYKDKGAIGIKKDGTTISSDQIVVTPTTIDTSVIGREYTIQYKATIDGKTVAVIRKVKVRDTIPPDIVTPKNTEMAPTTATFNVMDGVSATDNSKETIQVKASGNVVTTVPGVYVITYKASDSSGNTRTKKRTITIYNSICPLIRIQGDQPSGVPTNKDMNLTAKYVANEKEASEYDFQWQRKVNGVWTDISGATTNKHKETTDQNTNYRLVYKYADCNNITNEWNAYIDKTAPTCTVTTSGTGGNGGWYKSSVSLGLTRSDGTGSGVASYDLTKSSLATFNNSASGSQSDTAGTTWYGHVKDKAGNIGQCNTNVKVDTVSPTCSVGISGTVGDNSWYRSTVSVSLSKSDSNGIANYGLTTSSSTTYNGSSSASQSDTSGVTWRGYVQDPAGNTGSCSTNFKVDKTPPTISSFSASSTNASYHVLLSKLSIGASDANSMNMYVSNSGYGTGGSWESYTTSKNWNVGGSLNGAARTIYLSVKDAAGNTSTRSTTYTVYNQCSSKTQTYSYGSCSASCGGGTRTKYTYNTDRYTGANCGTTTSSESCNTQACPKNGWYNEGCWKYYKNGSLVYGWLNVSGSWYYLQSNACMVTGWLQNFEYGCSSGWYYFNPSGGAMMTNTTIEGWTLGSDGCGVQAAHTHSWNGRGNTIHNVGFSWTCTRGHSHTTAYYIYCSICGTQATSSPKYVCPTNPYGTADGWTIFSGK